MKRQETKWGGGGQVKFYHYKKGGGKRFIHTKGGYTKLLDS